MIIYDNMIYFMMANDISRERNNIFRSNEMISRERNNIHFSHRCPLRDAFTLGVATGQLAHHIELVNLDNAQNNVSDTGACPEGDWGGAAHIRF